MNINTWKILVSQSRIDDVLASIQSENIFDFLKDDILLLSSRYQRLKTNSHLGGLSFDEINKENNQITISTLDLIRKIEVHSQINSTLKEEIEYPKYCEHVSRMLYKDEIENKLKELDGWKVIETIVPETNGQKGNDLTKTYKFNSFLDVIEFMYISAKYMEQIDHHPKWENLWRSLTIRLSTWNIGHKISSLDFEVACYLDNLFQNQFKNKL